MYTNVPKKVSGSSIKDKVGIPSLGVNERHNLVEEFWYSGRTIHLFNLLKTNCLINWWYFTYFNDYLYASVGFNWFKEGSYFRGHSYILGNRSESAFLLRALTLQHNFLSAFGMMVYVLYRVFRGEFWFL